MDVRIRDLPETPNLNNADVIPLDTVDVYTAKATLNTLKQFVLAGVPVYYGDESTITLDNLTNTFSVKAQYLPVSGGTVEQLTLTNLPVTNYAAAPKIYVDNTVAQLAVDSDLKYALATNATISETLLVAGSATFNDNIDLNGYYIKNASLQTKVISVSGIYVLTEEDNGLVIAVSGLSASNAIAVSSGLPRGFNTTIIMTSTSAVRLSANPSVSVHSLSGALTIKGQYGVCRVMSYSADAFIVTGDLA